MASKKSAVVGRRLRRMLGSLLVAGFGIAWWSFIPHAVAEADDVVEDEPPMGPCLAPETPVAINHELPHANNIVMPELEIVARAPVTKPRRPVIKPVIEKPVIEKPVIEKPDVIAVLTPVVTLPVIDPTKIDLPPAIELDDDDDPPPVISKNTRVRIPRIRTRPS